MCYTLVGARVVPSPISGVVPSITPTHLAPATTPAATKETIKDLVADHTPVATVLVPAETPAMTKEAVKHLLFGVPEPTSTKEAVLVATPGEVAVSQAVQQRLLWCSKAVELDLLCIWQTAETTLWCTCTH